jgi:ATP-dependent RNA helicase DDX41
LDVIQEIEYVKEDDKLEYMLNCLQKTAPPVLVFAENKKDVDAIHEHLLVQVSWASWVVPDLAVLGKHREGEGG